MRFSNCKNCNVVIDKEKNGGSPYCERCRKDHDMKNVDDLLKMMGMNQKK